VPRLIAFLRAINVGGHTVKMDALRRHFAGLGLKGVETFIASGNVIFSSGASDLAALERRIERRLHEELGFEVATFLRTEAEVGAVARYLPFPVERMRAAGSLNVGFLAEALAPAERSAVMGLATDIDDFHLSGREVYWMCARRQSESTMSNAVFEKALKRRVTFRGLRTVERLAARLGVAGAEA